MEAIPRINAGDLVAKRALLDCTAIVSAPAAVIVSFLLQSLRVLAPEFNFLFCFDSTDSDHCGYFGCGFNTDETAFVFRASSRWNL